MVRNPNEMFREWEEELAELKTTLVTDYLSKSEKNVVLKRINRLCEYMGVPVPSYNSEAFTKWLRKDL